MRRISMIGRSFSRLLVKDAAPARGKKLAWLCQCECGVETTVMGMSLRSGRTKSCGCLNLELVTERATRHGGARTRPYRIWRGMIERCEDNRLRAYQWYGARGISVCTEWHDFAAFRAWAFVSGYQDHLSLDRVNNDGNYEARNCRWATPVEQANNRRVNPQQKLSDHDVICILSDERLHRIIAADYGICRQHVTAIKQSAGRPGSQAAAIRKIQRYAADVVALVGAA